MTIYRAKYKKELIDKNYPEIVQRLAKDNEWFYLTRHCYDLSARDGKTYEYLMLNNHICIDISELEFIEECPKNDTENSHIILTTKPKYKNLIPS